MGSIDEDIYIYKYIEQNIIDGFISLFILNDMKF